MGATSHAQTFRRLAGRSGGQARGMRVGYVSRIAALIFAAYTVACNSLPSWQSAFDSRRPLRIKRELVERSHGGPISRRTAFDSQTRNHSPEAA